MLDPKPRSHRLLAGGCAACAVVVGVLACNTPEPAAPDTAVRSALGLQRPLEERRGSPASNENHVVAPETFEAYRVPNDPEEETRLPPPPPPPPRPVRVNEHELRRVLDGKSANEETETYNVFYKATGKTDGAIYEARNLLRKAQQ